MVSNKNTYLLRTLHRK